MRLLAAAALLSGLGAATLWAAGGDALAGLVGKHQRTRQMGYVSGPPDMVTDVVDIRRVDAVSADVDLALFFFNGHTCEISGRAAMQGKRLVLRAPDLDREGAPPCSLALWREGRTLRWSDGANSCKDACGARGTLSQGSMPIGGR